MIVVEWFKCSEVVECGTRHVRKCWLSLLALCLVWVALKRELWWVWPSRDTRPLTVPAGLVCYIYLFLVSVFSSFGVRVAVFDQNVLTKSAWCVVQINRCDPCLVFLRARDFALFFGNIVERDLCSLCSRV